MTAHPDLVSNMYVLRFDEASDPKTLRLDPVSRRFQPVDFTAEFG